jgi:hypothetical protein
MLYLKSLAYTLLVLFVLLAFIFVLMVWPLVLTVILLVAIFLIVWSGIYGDMKIGEDKDGN